eukprot:scaffold7446_cov403-Prasinococcus_capsulatus_cf.AAC.9
MSLRQTKKRAQSTRRSPRCESACVFESLRPPPGPKPGAAICGGRWAKTNTVSLGTHRHSNPRLAASVLSYTFSQRPLADPPKSGAESQHFLPLASASTSRRRPSLAVMDG